jgi:hypothetical protein
MQIYQIQTQKTGNNMAMVKGQKIFCPKLQAYKAKATKAKPVIPREDHEQMKLVAWLDANFPDICYHAIPNGEKRNKITGYRLKLMGVKAGYPDIFIAEPKERFPGLYIEMKRVKGGKLSPIQDTVISKLLKRGYAVKVCAGMEDAKGVILNYLNGGI